MNDAEFRGFVRARGQSLYRPMPWREHLDPYWILISELMLQQTQVDRMRPKFDVFTSEFPDVAALAAADQSAVTKAWQGLGYNRRALYVARAARMIMDEFGGNVPSAPEDLVRLPGVGPNTAGAVAAYAYNQPVLFVETNVRTVYFHHFYASEAGVTDRVILEKLAQTIDTKNPREFYWALMDYGSHLKKSGVRVNHQSKHYKKQSKLQGSLREMRGLILKHMTMQEGAGEGELRTLFRGDPRFDAALAGLCKDGFLDVRGGEVYLTKGP